MRKFVTVAGLMTGVALLAANPAWGDGAPKPYSQLPIAPESARVDRVNPIFSSPTKIDNPLFPISTMQQKIQLGKLKGERKRVEFTLLPETKIIDWRGQKIETRVTQFLAFVDGEIEEVALDYHAQADDGSVWYLGEDVFDYKDGVIASHEGTWLTGRDGPPALIMPAKPKVGDVYRAENIPDVVFEEVTVVGVNETYEGGPRGPVKGVVRVKELHMDGTFEPKAFAPGYGEFLTDGENAAVAVPTDMLSTPEPAEISAILTGANVISTATGDARGPLSKALADIAAAWKTLKANRQPPLLVEQMDHAVGELTKAVKTMRIAKARQTAIAVALAALDFQMRYRPVPAIDHARLGVWASRAAADAQAKDAGAFTGDVAVLEWIWKRTGHNASPEAQRAVGIPLADLRYAATEKDLKAGLDAARKLQKALAAS